MGPRHQDGWSGRGCRQVGARGDFGEQMAKLFRWEGRGATMVDRSEVPLEVIDMFKEEYCGLCCIKFSGSKFCWKHYTGRGHAGLLQRRTYRNRPLPWQMVFHALIQVPALASLAAIALAGVTILTTLSCRSPRAPPTSRSSRSSRRGSPASRTAARWRRWWRPRSAIWSTGSGTSSTFTPGERWGCRTPGPLHPYTPAPLPPATCTACATGAPPTSPTPSPPAATGRRRGGGGR